VRSIYRPRPCLVSRWGRYCYYCYLRCIGPVQQQQQVVSPGHYEVPGLTSAYLLQPVYCRQLSLCVVLRVFPSPFNATHATYATQQTQLTEPKRVRNDPGGYNRPNRLNVSFVFLPHFYVLTSSFFLERFFIYDNDRFFHG